MKSNLAEQCDVLVVIAHPDDEIFASGTICLCTEKGFKVTLVCTTDGEGGWDELYGASSAQLGGIRRRELTLSASVLGVSDVVFLGFADVVNPADAGTRAWDQPKLIGELARIVRGNAPKLILTHGPLGGYGHPAHRLVHNSVTAAVRESSFSGSVFSFCAQVGRDFFSWHFDQPADVRVDARSFLRRRAASLSYHQSQIDYFTKPHFPRTFRKYLSALFGLVFVSTVAGRKRVPIGTATRFFMRFPIEGLARHGSPDADRHFFSEHFANDPRVQIDR